MVAFPISLLPLSFPNVHPGWGGIFGKTKLGDRDIVGNTDLSHFTFFKKKFTYLFLDRGEGREKESERNINMWLPLERLLLGTWPAAQECALTGNQTGDPLVCRLILSPLSHTSQGPHFTLKILKDPKGKFELDQKDFLGREETGRAGREPKSSMPTNPLWISYDPEHYSMGKHCWALLVSTTTT